MPQQLNTDFVWDVGRDDDAGGPHPANPVAVHTRIGIAPRAYRTPPCTAA
jgi:hypothetical protein